MSVVSPIERRVVERFLEGDKEAFREIYEKTKGYLYSIVYKMVYSRAEAEDLIHDIYIVVYKKRRTFNFSAQFTTWLYRVAVNHVINHLKRKRIMESKLVQFFFTKDQETEDPDPFESQESGQAAKALLDKVKPEFRVCLVMHELEEIPYNRIAEHLGISIGTVKSRLNRAKKELSKAYEEEHGHGE